jgi:hypothetical protein
VFSIRAQAVGESPPKAAIGRMEGFWREKAAAGRPLQEFVAKLAAESESAIQKLI